MPCIWLLELNHSLHVSLLSNQTKISFDIQHRFELTSSSTNGYLDHFNVDEKNSIIDKYAQNELTTTITIPSSSKQEDLNLKRLLQKPQEFILKVK